MTHVMLRQAVLPEVPEDLDNEDQRNELLIKVRKLLQFLGYTQDVDSLVSCAATLVTRFGDKYGKSNLVLWRLNLMTVPQLRELSGLPPYSSSEVSHLATGSCGTVH